MNVHLRKIELSDTANIVKWRNSDDVRKNLFTQDDLTEEQHNNWFHSKVETGYCAQYIIQAVDNDVITDIGTTFIKGANSSDAVGEFGIFIGEPSFRGKHLASYATMEMIKIGFEELRLKNIFLTVFQDNVPARKTYEKLGFEPMSKTEVINGKDVLYMSLSRQKWSEITKDNNI